MLHPPRGIGLRGRHWDVIGVVALGIRPGSGSGLKKRTI